MSDRQEKECRRQARRTVSALGKLRGTATPRVSVSDGVLARLRDEPDNDGGAAPPPL